MASPLPPLEGKYEILEKLHEGGMGSIYKVRHRLLDSVRAIKTMRPQLASDEEFQARFLREARVAIRLDHPNIAKLYDFSIASDGMAFIVMEFISGLTLRQILQGMGPPELAMTLEISQQTLKALGFLHRQGFVHRDIAPDNIMLTVDGDGKPLVKLIDLGIAKSLEGGDDLTEVGRFLGKARYSSPEHFGERGAAGIDTRSDVYSFAVVLYEFLTGRTPIEGEDLRALSAGHLYRPPLPFEKTDLTSTVPDDLRRIVMRALSKLPDDRFPDTRVFAEALEHIRLRYPLPAMDFEELFEQIRTSREVVQAYTSLRTQVRLDRQFGQETTPTRGGLEARKDATPTDIDLPAPEAVIARIDQLAAEDEASVLDGVDDGSTIAVPLPETRAETEELRKTKLIDQEDLRRTQLVDQEQLLQTQRVDVEDLQRTQLVELEELRSDQLADHEQTPALEDPDEYGTESTYLPAAEAPEPPPPTEEPNTEVVREVEEPASAPPAIAEPVYEKPVYEKPVYEKPVYEKPVSEKPASVPAAGSGFPAAGSGFPAALTERRWQVAAAAAVALVVVVLAVLFLGRSSTAPDQSVSEELVTRPEPVPEQVSEPTPPTADADRQLNEDEIHPALLRGRRCLIAGDRLCAIVAIKDIEAESLSLAPQELELLGDLRAGLESSLAAEAAADPRALGERLRDALATGPITELRDVFDTVVELRQQDPESFAPELSETIATAGEIVSEWRLLWRLKRSQDELGVARIATRLIELYPPYALRSQIHREEAAEAIELQAQGLVAEGDLGTARARLAELRDAFPDRQGLRERIASLDRRLTEDREIEGVIARAESALAASEPNRGLELLSQLADGGGRYASQVTALRDRLQRRLLDMDRKSPEIRELPEAEYRRNQPATIPLEITDDFRVENVRAWARAGREGAFTEVTIRHEGGDAYTVEVPAAVHDNKRNLDFYVWVADRSGNTATLGTETAPRSLRRKGLF